MDFPELYKRNIYRWLEMNTDRIRGTSCPALGKPDSCFIGFLMISPLKHRTLRNNSRSGKGRESREPYPVVITYLVSFVFVLFTRNVIPQNTKCWQCLYALSHCLILLLNSISLWMMQPRDSVVSWKVSVSLGLLWWWSRKVRLF